jgi:SAM-dependent methyltransferase
MNVLSSLKYTANRVRYALNFPLQKRNQLELTRDHDGFPLPPPRLEFLVQWSYDLTLYWKSGIMGHECLNNTLCKAGFHADTFANILDFGCGCGRVIRHWRPRDQFRLHGCDYNPVLIEWCETNLTFGDFRVNQPVSKLDYANNAFDFIYASSVFTHLSREQEKFWMAELRRILTPNGVLLITTKGECNVEEIQHPWDQACFRNGSRVVVRPNYCGTNICGVYMGLDYVAWLASDTGWNILYYAKGAALDQNKQDIYLLRKTL